MWLWLKLREWVMLECRYDKFLLYLVNRSWQAILWLLLYHSFMLLLLLIIAIFNRFRRKLLLLLKRLGNMFYRFWQLINSFGWFLYEYLRLLYGDEFRTGCILWTYILLLIFWLIFIRVIYIVFHINQMMFHYHLK